MLSLSFSLSLHTYHTYYYYYYYCHIDNHRKARVISSQTLTIQICPLLFTQLFYHGYFALDGTQDLCKNPWCHPYGRNGFLFTLYGHDTEHNIMMHNLIKCIKEQVNNFFNRYRKHQLKMYHLTRSFSNMFNQKIYMPFLYHVTQGEFSYKTACFNRLEWSVHTEELNMDWFLLSLHK